MYVDQWGEIHPPPDPEKGKPLNPHELGGNEETGVSGHTSIEEKVQRYGTAKARNRQMADHLAQLSTVSLATKRLYGRLSHAMYECASWLVLHHYPASGQTRVGRTTTCKKHLLCPVCAILRSAKMLRRYEERITHLAPSHDFELVTLTVKNGPDLWERFLHLKHAFKRLRTRGRDGYGPWVDVAGAVWSVEFTYSDEHGWHPHLHIITAKAKGATPFRYGQGSPLSNEWHNLTGDSYIVHASPVSAHGDGIAAAVCEVLKYALKFSDLSPEKNLHAFHTLSGKRLIASSGCLFGLVLPDEDNGIEEPIDEHYVELFYRYTSGGYTRSDVPSPHTPKGTP
jgi:hypothetical protein